MREELIALREEIQRDRHAITQSMNDGFDRVIDKLSEHERRITDVERTQKVMGGGLVTVITAFIGAAFAWLFGR